MGIRVYRLRRMRSGQLQWERVRQEAQSLLKYPERLGQPVVLPMHVARTWGTRWILEAISDLWGRTHDDRTAAKRFLFAPNLHFEYACAAIDADVEIVRGFAKKYLQADAHERRDIKRRLRKALHMEHMK